VKAFIDMAAAARTSSDFLSLGIAMRRSAGRELSIPDCLDVTRTALGNRNFLATCDEQATAQFVYFAESIGGDADRDRIFQFFFPLIGSVADNRFEFAAADAIGSAAVKRSLTPKQIARLSTLRAACHNELVISRLDLAMLGSGN
jgi:hypothetical protein